MSGRFLRVCLSAAAAGSVGIALVAVASAQTGAGGSGFSGKITYDETNGGQQQGQAYKGIVGQGQFSGTLSGGAAVAAKLVGAMKGIPVAGLLRGGTYVVRLDVDDQGVGRGLLVATFKTPGLGSLCVSFTATPGAFKQGDSFIPVNGSFTLLGGTGRSAALRGSARFKQTDIGDVPGGSGEQILATGTLLAVSSGASRPLTRECKAVAKLAKP